MFTRSERLISSILGSTRWDIRPMACTLDIIIEIHFVKHIPKGDIRLTRSVYPLAAIRLEKSVPAIAKSVERLANLCWDMARGQNRILELVGRDLYDIPSVSDILFYLAYLLYFHKPFFTVLDDLDRLSQADPEEGRVNKSSPWRSRPCGAAFPARASGMQTENPGIALCGCRLAYRCMHIIPK